MRPALAYYINPVFTTSYAFERTAAPWQALRATQRSQHSGLGSKIFIIIISPHPPQKYSLRFLKLFQRGAASHEPAINVGVAVSLHKPFLRFVDRFRRFQLSQNVFVNVHLTTVLFRYNKQCLFRPSDLDENFFDEVGID